MAENRSYHGKAAAVAGQFKKERDYWVNKLSGDISRTSFPATFSRPPEDRDGEPSGEIRHRERVEFNVEDGLFQRLQKVSGGSDARMHVILVSITALLLNKYTGSQDILLGVPVYKQESGGDLVNTVLTVRNAITPGLNFKELLLRTNKTISEAADHQNYPINSLVYQLNLEEQDEAFPLFDVAVLLDNIHLKEYLDPVTLNVLFHFSREDQRLAAIIEFNPGRYSPSMMSGLSRHFTNLLETVIFNVEEDVTFMSILTAEEKQDILHRFNDTRAGFPHTETIHQIFSRQAAKTPSNTALILPSGEESGTRIELDYKRLDFLSSILAEQLIARGVAPDTIVALLMERSVEMIVAILAVLKAGGAYLPIEPGYPSGRIRYMLSDSSASLCLTAGNGGDNVDLPCETMELDLDLETKPPAGPAKTFENGCSPGNLAYIIYTSGTTGNPKGVMIEHRHVVRLLFNDSFQFDFSENDVWTMFHSYCFDFSVWEMYGPLLYGGTLVLVPKEAAMDSQRFATLLERENVTVLNQTPSSFYRLMAQVLGGGSESGPSGLRYIIFGGEALNPARLKQWRRRFPQTRLINMYGITETTVHVTFKELSDHDIQAGFSNIGGPIPTLSTYILDHHANLLPVGVPGELAVGGEGVARGYLNRPGLTAAKFIPNPHVPNERLYLSGDLGRFHRNGEIEYLGRKDSQVKIRGYRIELGEIETRLIHHPQVKTAVVVDKTDHSGDKFLCAYIVPSGDSQPATAELREFLSTHLPEYMVPSYIVTLDGIPLTPNGKLDRKALPDPETDAAGPYIPPSTQTEKKLAVIWAEVLGMEIEKIGVKQSFFELGGHSLKATSLVLLIHKTFDVKIPLVEIFRTPFIGDLAIAVENAAKEQYQPIPRCEKKEYYPLSSAQHRFYTIHNMYPDGVAYNIPQLIPLNSAIDPQRLTGIFESLIDRHESFRTSFQLIGETVVQRIHDEVDFSLQMVDLSGESGEPGESAVNDYLARFVAPFDLAKAPLLRVSLVKLPDAKQLMTVDLHHIITDGVSNDILVEEFTSLLDNKNLEPLSLQYSDFAHWRNTPDQQEIIDNQRQFWLKTFQGKLPRLTLPTDYGVTESKDGVFAGRSLRYTLSGSKLATFKRAVNERNTTSFVLLFAVYNILMSKLSGLEDIICGTAIAGRKHPDLMKIIGLFFSSLAMRNFPKAELTFGGFLDDVRQKSLDAFENQDYPFERLVQDLARTGAISRDAGRNPLFDTMFSLHNFGVDAQLDDQPQDSRDSHDLPYDPFALQNDTAKFDLLLNVVEHPGKLDFVLDYSTNLFAQSTAQQIMDNFLLILHQVIADDSVKLEDIHLEGDLAKRASQIAADNKELREREFWLDKLSGELGKSSFPYDMSSNDAAVTPGSFSEFQFRFNDSLCQRLGKVSNQSDIRLFIILLSGIAALAANYTGNPDTTLLSPIDRQEDGKDFINSLLILRCKAHEHAGFKELLLHASVTLSEAVEHINYPLETLLYHLGIDYDGKGVFPLSDIMVMLENIHEKEYVKHINTNIRFEFQRQHQTIQGKVIYNPMLFRPATIAGLTSHLEALLQKGLFDLETPLSGLDIISPQEKQKILIDFNRTGPPQYPEAGLTRLFSQCLEKHPDRVAVISENHYVTYRELDTRARRLSRVLCARGVCNGGIVALLTRRSVEMITSILGTLFAGASYLPLSPENPPQRNLFMLQDSRAAILITTDSETPDWAKEETNICEVLNADIFVSGENGADYPASPNPPRLTAREPFAGDLAYIIYTSGSTGQPKAVMMEHHGVINLVHGLNERIYNHYEESLSVAMVAPYVFDASVQQMFAVLLGGHTLDIIEEENRVDGEALLQHFQERCTDICDGTPSHIRLLVESLKSKGPANINGQLPRFTVRHFIIGGEALPRSLVERFFTTLNLVSDITPDTGISNVYGPTECCVDSTSYLVTPGNLDDYPDIPIGKPMPGEQVYILDRQQGLKPIGAVGELCIGGGGVGRGYLKRPALTSEKFTSNPYFNDVAGELNIPDHMNRIYRTGDLARWLPDGNIQFLGRMDNQIQLRGFRIEIGEIENVLLSHEDIKEALVLLRTLDDRDNDDLYICAYAVSDKILVPAALREFMFDLLPEYMIPSFFIQLKQFPLTPNGKIDRKSLPGPELDGHMIVAKPQTLLQEKMQTLWADVLGIEEEMIGIDRDFFEVGGHSLKATILISRLAKEFQVQVAIADIFSNATIRRLTHFIETLHKTGFSPVEPVEKKQYYVLSSAQKRLYIVHQLLPDNNGYNSPAAVILSGGIQRSRLENTFLRLIQRHESLRTAFISVNEQPVQRILDFQDVRFKVDYWDLQETQDQQENEPEVHRLLRDFVRPFHLANAPLFRAGLIRLDSDRHVLTVDMHHIISDGVSEEVLLSDFLALYHDGEPEPLKLQYKDFAQWQNETEQVEAIKKQEAYWVNRFTGKLPVVDLPGDYPRSAMQSFDGKALRFQLSDSLTGALDKLASDTGATLYMVMLAAFNILIAKLCGKEDIIIGSPVAGRRHADLERIVGMFVNILAMRNAPVAEKSFQAFLADVKLSSVQAFENQEYPYEDLVDRVVRKRDLSRNPLFDVVFNLLNVKDGSKDFSGSQQLKMEPYGHEFNIIKFDLLLTAQQVEQTIYFSLEYCTRLFKEDTIKRWGGFFIKILETITSQPGIAITDIDVPREYGHALPPDLEEHFDASGQFKRERDYWLNKLSGHLTRSEFPYSSPLLDSEVSIGEPSMETVDFNLEQRQAQRLVKMSGQSDSRLHVALTAAISLLLNKYTGHTDIILGAPVYRQERQGDLVNTVLALRNNLAPGQSFKELLIQVTRTVAEAAEHQNYPILSLAYLLDQKRDDDRFPLFDTAVLLENIHDGEYMTPVNINILFRFNRKDQDISGRVEFNANYYEPYAVRRFIDHLVYLLDASIFDVHQSIEDIEMLSDREKEQLLYQFNDTAAAYPEDMTLTRLFANQVRQTPDNIAVSMPVPGQPGPGPSLTYRELDEKAGLLAGLLVQRGVGCETVVAMLLERSLDMMVSIMAILKAGGAYLPLDPDYPQNRVLYMLTDSATTLCLTTTDLTADHLFPCPTLFIDQPFESSPGHGHDAACQPNNLAYIIYTSGTTGNPKGVMIEHRNVVRLMFNDAFQFDFTSGDVWTMFHSYCFDFSVWEMYGALLYGGRLVMVSKDMARDTQRFLECLQEENVTVLNQTPSSFYQLMELALARREDTRLTDLRYVIFGGEALKPARLKQWRQLFPHTALINMYGITETTVHVTYKEITGNEIQAGTSNIGTPIPTLTTYIMGSRANLLPVGAPGEITVGGPGVGRGYLNRPELTGEKFIPNPYIPNDMIYRSGDLGQRRENGDILYLGRIDSQVKIRGFRIELGEIENRLMMIPNVKSAVVTDHTGPDNETCLCAYVVPVDYHGYESAALRSTLSDDLPDYMIPSYFVQMEHIPLTPNGKVDRKALPDPEIGGIGPYVPPANPMEEKLTQIWAEVLGAEPRDIGVEHNFFDLGGHSLKATSLVLAIHKAFNTRIPLAEVFKTPTIRELALYIRDAASDTFEAIPVAENKEYYPLSAAQRRFYTIHNMFPDSTAYNISQAIPMSGSPDPAKLESIFKELIQRHEVLRTTFDVVRGEAVQRVHDTVPFQLRHIDLSQSGGPGGLEEVMKDLVTPFDLNRAPLLRAALVSTPDKGSFLVVDLHHIVTDGTSNQLLIEDFNALNRDRALTPLTLQYKDFADWQNTASQQRKINQQERFWLNEFAGEIPVLELPTDFPRQSQRNLQGDSVSHIIPENLTSTLKQMAHGEQVTLFMLLLAAYNVLLMKICGQEEIVVGTGINGRRDRALMRVIGLFFTPLAMRSHPKAGKSFKEFLEEVKETTINVFENQDYPFEQLVQKLTEKNAIQPHSNRNPLYDTMFGFHEPLEKEQDSHPRDSSQDSPETPPEHELNHDSTAKLDLLLNTLERDNTLWLVMDYSTMLFKKETVERIVHHYVEILEQVIRDIDIKLVDIRLSGDVEEIVSKVDDADATNFTF